MIKRFEDLEVWRVARELAKGVYRAAVSISSNIAEAFERGSRKQHIEFTYIAKGSAGELRSQVIVAHDAGLLDEAATRG